MRNKNGFNNYSHINNFSNQKQHFIKNNVSDNYLESNMNNKFNINNSFDNINNFYSKNLGQNFLPNMNFNINNNINNNQIYNDSININQISNSNNINTNNIFNINDTNKENENEKNNINNNIVINKKELIFKKLNLNINLGEKNLVKELIIDIENSDISKIVKDLLKEYNLKEEYFDSLLNIIEKAISVLINIDKINPSKYALKNLEQNKKIFDENDDIDDSLILDFIENRNYKEYFDNILSDIYNIKFRQDKLRSYSCKHRTFK
jgi:hypothetical protein